MRHYRTIVPPIKCQGIKTKLVPWIRSLVPADFRGRWIEPFMGSGVVAFNVRPKRALLADSNPHLINFYQAVAQGSISSGSVRRFLEYEGSKLLRSEGEYYYTVRERFNRLGNPLDFLFLNRACFNGLMRFNRDGAFNVPFCRKPARFSQAYITKIANQVQTVSQLLRLGTYEFVCQDFSETMATAQRVDFGYCDPPYIARHSDYFNSWDERHEEELSVILKATTCRFVLSTWHSNEFRENDFITKLWSEFHLTTRRHYYHLGGKEANRRPIREALITNFVTEPIQEFKMTEKQLLLLQPDTTEKGPFNFDTSARV